MKFDDAFIELLSQYDLLVLGGGGFFDLTWDYSTTGTTIDFSKQIIQTIKIPVLVNGMGYHEYGEVKEDNVNKFRRFLDAIVNNDNWLVSVRNDGSFRRMHNRYDSLVDKVLVIPDHGFFFSPKEHHGFGLKNEDRTWVGMSITNDLFTEKFNRDIDVDTFNDLISQFINQVLGKNSNYGIILFPHTHQDISTIGVLMGKINEKYRREKLVVAPLFCGEGEAIECVFDLYRACLCIIAMRLHANVCSIGINIPTIGLAGHVQISSMYDEIGLSERCIKVNSRQFVDELLYKLNESLNMLDEIKQDYVNICLELNNKADMYHKKIRDWIIAG